MLCKSESHLHFGQSKNTGESAKQFRVKGARWYPHSYFRRSSFVLTADHVPEITEIFSLDASLTFLH